MKMYDIIQNKRDGIELTEEEIRYFVKGICDHSIPEYQTSALLMAIYLNGMNGKETAHLCKYMAHSGDMLKLDESLSTVDKHSTGGVGDKTTFIVSPIVACLGLYVAKMSGRGLGHTGGTIDKLESIPGFKTQLSSHEFESIYRKIGLCVIGQTGNMVPADKIMYALRDVTATVESIPLIASSIMSKKLAGGAKNIVLDVKMGKGSFMKDKETAQKLALEMVEIGSRNQRNVSALITSMDQPLGRCVGNSLEVLESIQLLSGEYIPDLYEVSVALAAEMLHLGNDEPIDQAYQKVKEVMTNQKALDKFQQMIQAQGGDPQIITQNHLLPKSKKEIKIIAKQSGYVQDINAQMIGKVSMDCGAGRETKEDDIDYGAGIILEKIYGEYVNEGEVLAKAYTLKANDEKIIEATQKAYVLSKQKPQKRKIIFSRVTKNGIEEFN